MDAYTTYISKEAKIFGFGTRARAHAGHWFDQLKRGLASIVSDKSKAQVDYRQIGKDTVRQEAQETQARKPSRLPWLIAGGAALGGAAAIGRASAPSRRHYDGSYNIPKTYW